MHFPTRFWQTWLDDTRGTQWYFLTTSMDLRGNPAVRATFGKGTARYCGAMMRLSRSQPEIAWQIRQNIGIRDHGLALLLWSQLIPVMPMKKAKGGDARCLFQISTGHLPLEPTGRPALTGAALLKEPPDIRWTAKPLWSSRFFRQVGTKPSAQSSSSSCRRMPGGYRPSVTDVTTAPGCGIPFL